MAGTSTPVVLWRNANPTLSQMWEFKERIETTYGADLSNYEALHKWSIENLSLFWKEVWHFTRVRSSQERQLLEPFNSVLNAADGMFPRPNFFEGSQLNFAENLLYPLLRNGAQIDDEESAIIWMSESEHWNMSWRDLRMAVKKCALALSSIIKPHDRIAGFLGNHAWTVVAMLATTSLGGIWTAVSPDTGVAAVLDRLVQIEPTVLFADNGVKYNGKVHESMTKVNEITKSLQKLKAVVIFETVEGVDPTIGENFLPTDCKRYTYSEFILSSKEAEERPFIFQGFPPSHPTYILYSSGTTGKPKCIVHSSIGTLIQHKKEHVLHCDIRPKDRVFFYTTTTWMMWHWLVSGLASGATLMLYDGSPFHPHGELSMPKIIDEFKITHFGTSAKYLSILEQKAVMPRTQNVNLDGLKAIYSTGSPLAPSTFKYVYEAFPKHVQLGSITGGTDIISLFGAPSPISPVYQGEIQCKGLGMDIAAMGPDGEIVKPGEPGDLVCRQPFPCQPVAFFGPDGQEKYRKSYFDVFEGIWHHGDFVTFTQTGGMLMLGRSDGILKPAGVRFGSAEIYNVLLKHFSIQIEDALCIGRRREHDTDEAVVLFLKMASGEKFTPELAANIKALIKYELSARHVPHIVDECFEIPVTTNGKKVEVAVKQILCGLNVKISASVANSECLEWYREWNRVH